MIIINILPDFDWDGDAGEILNLIFNPSGGLELEDLTLEEKQLLKKHGFLHEE